MLAGNSLSLAQSEGASSTGFHWHAVGGFFVFIELPLSSLLSRKYSFARKKKKKKKSQSVPTEWVSDGEREDFLSRSERLIGRHGEKLYRIVPVPRSVSCRLLCSCQMYAIIWQLSDLVKCDKKNKKNPLCVISRSVKEKERKESRLFSV